MSDQPQPFPQSRRMPDHPPLGVVTFFRWMPLHKSGIMLVLSWLAPFAIMAIGYFLFPSLRVPVSWPWHAAPELWAGITVQLVCTIVWILYEIWYTTHRNSSVKQLQTDVVGDLTTTLSLLLIFGASLNARTLQWWFLVPLCGALIDLFQSTLLGINNAAEKPYVSPKGTS
jgi:hypothetical protein